MKMLNYKQGILPQHLDNVVNSSSFPPFPFPLPQTSARSLLLLASCLLVSTSWCPVKVEAQISEDGTVSTQVTTTDFLNFLIENGDRIGDNLFHSFLEFSVPTNGSAFFNNAEDIANIFSRVTGGSISEIDGLIGANGAANLFLLNPAGIIFGPNGALDIGGSFLATTADSFVFEDGVEFSAVNPQAPSLLTVNIPIGLRFRDNPGDIVNQSTFFITVPNESFPNSADGLRVNEGQSLVLVGGNVSLEGGSLRAPGGRIEIGGLAEAGIVGLNIDGSSISMSFPDGITRGDVSLTAPGIIIPEIDVTAGGGGDIAIYARNIDIFDGSDICAGIGANSACGGLATSLSSSTAQAGDIIIHAQGTITLKDEISVIANDIADSALGTGGNINITAQSIIMKDGSNIQNVTSGTGNAGNITIQTGSLSLTDDGTQILPTTSGSGNAGNLLIRASGAIEIIGESIESTLPTGLATQAQEGSTGNAGDITIEAKSLTLANEAQIQADVFRSFEGEVAGQGQGGNIQIDVTDFILITGVGDISGGSSGIFASVETDATGPGGDITIKANSLTIADGGIISSQTRGAQNGGNIIINANTFEASGGGQVISTTSGSGTAGNITLNIADTVALSGQDPTFTQRFNRFEPTNPGLVLNAGSASGLFVSGNDNARGDAGSISVNTDILKLDDGAEISAENQGSGRPGNVSLNADAILLQNNSSINTNVNLFDGADGGGNISMNTIVLAASGNSDITANAVQGNAGRIEIIADAVFGLEIRDEQTDQSDITAFSELDPALNGEVIFNDPEVDPSQGLIKLPEEVVDQAQLVTQSSCQLGSGSQFASTGRGGVPPNPNDAINSDTVRVDLVKPVASTTNDHQGQLPTTPTSDDIVPAQGWIFTDQGQVLLVGYNPNDPESKRIAQRKNNCVPSQ